MNRLGIVCVCVALMLAAPALAQEMDYRTSAGLIFTYVPEAQTVVGNGSGLTVVDTRSGSIWTITGPLPAAALVPPSLDDTSLEALADAFAASFGAGAALDRDAERALEHPDGAALLIPFTLDDLHGTAALIRADDGRILLVTGIGGRAGTAAALADETAALLARIRIGDPVDAPSGTDAPVVLGDPPAAVAFAVPDGFRAAPFNGDSALAVLDTLPGAEAYIQVNIRLNTDASLTPALWKAQFFAGLADRVGDAGYDPETSWLPLTDEAEGAAVEVYRAVGLSDALSATAYLVTLSPRTFVVITALTPDAAALEAQAAALDALALSVRLFSGN